MRRHLHAHPELSGAERQTTAYLAGLLRQAGFAPRLADDERGLVVDSAGATSRAARVALRADIDALPIHEVNPVDYCSRTAGVMHACGHDAHATSLYGALLGLRALESTGELPWPVAWRGIFQPAEETLVGAAGMVSQGCLEGVAAIFGQHVDPGRPVGRIGVRAGAFTANCDTLQFHIGGRGGHAARPHDTRDPIAAAAQLIAALYAFVPRAIDSQDPVVVSIGMIQAGQAANVIPGEARLLGTLRTLDRRARARAQEQIRQIAGGIAAASGTTIEVEIVEGISAVLNDPGANELVRQAATEVLGAEHVEPIARPSMGSEDFAAYLDHVPGAMYRLGCASETAGNSALHTPTFNVDERALAIGAKVLARAAILWCDPSRD
ncbi:MAG: amidohydrolase [Planctomycetaceae bacterium]|nr:amidohydrolase [Planctomycetaceae bacterium]